jgi:hypothetical protein
MAEQAPGTDNGVQRSLSCSDCVPVVPDCIMHTSQGDGDDDGLPWIVRPFIIVFSLKPAGTVCATVILRYQVPCPW